MQITIYTDGACDIHAANQPGGWAAILCAVNEKGQVIKETVISGGQEMTTNNQMELTAVIKGLKQLQRPSDITIVTDSKYVIDIATKTKRAAKNKALWREYFEVAKIHDVTWQYVAGHSGNAYNEHCDKLAVAERRKYALYKVEAVNTSTFEPADTAITVYLVSTYSSKQKRSAWSAYTLRDGDTEALGDVLLNNETYYEALLVGAIQTLKKLPSDETITIYTAQQNLVKSMNERISRWMQNDWTYRYKDGDEVKSMPVKYKHHWQELWQLTQKRTVHFKYDKLLRCHPPYKRARHNAKRLIKNSE